MAYLVFSSHKGEEIGRRRLDGSVTIGRAPDCDVSLHDHLLSRHHCKLEKTEDGWAVTDLGSRNGTIVHGEPVKRHVLHDGESFTIGRVKVRFRSGSLAKGQETTTVTSGRPKRPADPFDALSGTVAGYRYEPPAEEKHIRDVDQFPSPKPVMTDSGRFVAVTDSGRFVGVTDDVWLTDVPDEAEQSGSAPHGLVAEGSRIEKAAGEGDARHVARPKAPEGVDLALAAKAELGPPPLPPSAPLRLRVTPFFKKLGSKLRHPLGRWAAVLLALAGIGALVVAVM